MKCNVTENVRNTQISESNQTFVDVPHNSGVVNRPRHHEVSIPCPADVIHILNVSPKDKSNSEKFVKTTVDTH